MSLCALCATQYGWDSGFNAGCGAYTSFKVYILDLSRMRQWVKGGCDIYSSFKVYILYGCDVTHVHNVL